MEIFVGMILGSALTILVFTLIGLSIEQYLRNPFLYATVADFEHRQEGG